MFRREKYPTLVGMTHSYFGQGILAIYKDYKTIVNAYIEAKPEHAENLVKDAQKLLAKHPSDKKIQKLVDKWSGDYIISGEGITPTEWLTYIATRKVPTK